MEAKKQLEVLDQNVLMYTGTVLLQTHSFSYRETTHALTVHLQLGNSLAPAPSTHVLLTFIKEKFSRQGGRGRGVGTSGICELQNQKVISKPLNTSAINAHSPGGAGPAATSAISEEAGGGRDLSCCTTAANGNSPGRDTRRATAAKRNSVQSYPVVCALSGHVFGFRTHPPRRGPAPFAPQLEWWQGHELVYPSKAALRREPPSRIQRGEGLKSKALSREAPKRDRWQRNPKPGFPPSTCL